MPKRDLGKEERDRLRGLEGDAGAVWRGVYGRNEDEWFESLVWEDAQAQAKRPHVFVTKYRGARGKPKRSPATKTATDSNLRQTSGRS